MEIEGLADLTPEGSGGFSQVLRAVEAQYSRTVAAKVLKFRLESDDDRERFEEECRAMAQLSDHPHIVPLYFTTYTDQGFPVIVMEFFSGGTLSQWARGSASTPELLDAGVKIASALQCAHERGVIHRDVKPQNVLLSAFGQPALTDFGISAITQQRATAEQTKGITLAYAAPEALEGQSNARTDVYSLAATMYTVLTNRRLFAAPKGTKQSAGELVRRIMTEEALPMQHFGLSNEVDRVVRRVGLAKDPLERPATAREFGELIQSLQRHEGFEVTPWVEANESSNYDEITDHGNDSVTVVRPHHINTTPAPSSVEEPSVPATWSSRRTVALIAGALAVAVLGFLLFVGGRDSTEPVTGQVQVVLPTPDPFYTGPIFPPTDVVIERVGNGTAIVSWADPNDATVEFEIERVDEAGRDEEPITASGTRAELVNISDSVAPCIIMRAFNERQTSNDIASPVCLAPSPGDGPRAVVIPSRCAVATCDFRLDVSGLSSGATVSIVVEDPEGRDLNAIVDGTYEATAVVDAAGEIDWSFRPSSEAALGDYRVFVLDDPTGLSTVTFFTVFEA